MRPTGDFGLGLVELVIGLAITGLIAGVLGMTVIATLRDTSAGQDQQRATQQLRNALFWLNQDTQSGVGALATVTSGDATMHWTDYATGRVYSARYQQVSTQLMRTLTVDGVVTTRSIAGDVVPGGFAATLNGDAVTYTLTVARGSSTQSSAETTLMRVSGALPTPFPTVTAAATFTATSTWTPSSTPTATETASATPTGTSTATATPTQTVMPTVSATVTQTVVPSMTFTATATATNTLTPTATATSTATAVPTATSTPTTTPTPTSTPTSVPTATNTPTPTATNTPTAVPTATNTPPACAAGDTGYLSPSANAADTGGDGNGFESTPANAYADGGGHASNVKGNGDRHHYYNYGVNVPAGNGTICGIEVRLDYWLKNNGGTTTIAVQLSWDGGATWTAAKGDSSEPQSETSVWYGSGSDSWGRSWSVANLGDGNFRVRVTMLLGASGQEVYLDWIPVRIYYAP